MKRTLPTLLIALTLAFGTACGEMPPGPADPTDSEKTEQTDSGLVPSDTGTNDTLPDDTEPADPDPVTPPADTDLGPVNGFIVLTDPAIPTMEEIERLVAHAAEIWNRMSIGTLDAEYGKPADDEGRYYPVRDYKTRTALEKRFAESFTAELTETFLGELFDGLYREIDGRLCVMPADRGTDSRAGVESLEAQVVDDTTVRVIRRIAVFEILEDGEDFIWYPVGFCPQELMLVYEDGRWVFDTFTVWDNLSLWDDGKGEPITDGRAIAEAFLKKEKNPGTVDSIAYAFNGFSRSIGSIKENADGSRTVTLKLYADRDSGSVRFPCSFTARKTEAGWEFEDFLPLEAIAHAALQTQFHLVLLAEGSPDSAPAAYLEKNPEAVDAILANGKAALPYLLHLAATDHKLTGQLAAQLAFRIDPAAFDRSFPSPDGKFLLKTHDPSGLTGDGIVIHRTLSLIDAATGEVLASAPLASANRNAVIHWSPDGKWAAVTDDNPVRVPVYNAVTLERIASVNAYSDILPFLKKDGVLGDTDSAKSCILTVDGWTADSLIIGFAAEAWGDHGRADGSLTCRLSDGSLLEPEYVHTPLPEPQYDETEAFIRDQLAILVGDPAEGTDAADYISAHPEAFDAIVARGREALDCLQRIGSRYYDYQMAGDTVKLHRALMAMTAAYHIDGDLYDAVWESPDGKHELRLKAESFFTLLYSQSGITYDRAELIEKATGRILIVNEGIFDGFMEAEWSPDGRFALLKIPYAGGKYGTGLLLFDTVRGRAEPLPTVEMAYDASAASIIKDRFGADIGLYAAHPTGIVWQDDGTVLVELELVFGAASNPFPVSGSYVWDPEASSFRDAVFAASDRQE